uniref:30S ribosomal protein S6, chloroplastic n=1 Tax=Crouania attenuata TaxID=42002 RepID=A0A4D6WRZ9_9FLOR|nr:ribosomal protein S6 [Crouania attenuata]
MLMFLNSYETIYILKPDVSESITLDVVNFYKSFIKMSGGQEILVQHRGRRHLGYKIMNYYDGIYVQVNYKGNGSLVKSIEKSMKLNESILRYLTIKQQFCNSMNIL